MIDANDKAKIEYGRDFDAVLDMTLFSANAQRAATPGRHETKEPS